MQRRRTNIKHGPQTRLPVNHERLKPSPTPQSEKTAWKQCAVEIGRAASNIRDDKPILFCRVPEPGDQDNSPMSLRSMVSRLGGGFTYESETTGPIGGR
jgi:hypothetical protein